MENFKRKIFDHLGGLFYAIAKEQDISLLGLGELKMLVRKDWRLEREGLSQDKVSEAAHLIGLAIDTMQRERVPVAAAYSIFERFYLRHQEQFSYALKENIMDTAETILKIFPLSDRKNEYYEALRKLFKQSTQRSEVED